MAIAHRRVSGVCAAPADPAVSRCSSSPARAGPAQAADGYKYWNYFHVEDGKYVFAQTGPADFTPKDGAVEAYRYGLSSTADGLPAPHRRRRRTPSTTSAPAPRPKPARSWSGCCSTTAPRPTPTAARRRPSRGPPAPAVPTKANGQQVLDAVADVRLEKGLTCGIDGYPVKGCSVTVKNPPAAAAAGERRLRAAEVRRGRQSDAGLHAGRRAETDDSGFPWTLVRRRGRRRGARRRRPRARPARPQRLSRRHAVRAVDRLTFPRSLHPGAWWLWAVGARGGGQPHPEPGAAGADPGGHRLRGRRPTQQRALGRGPTSRSSSCRWS